MPSLFRLAFRGFCDVNALAVNSSVHKLREVITSGQPSLTQLLRQTKWVAAKLNLADVQHWVDLELNGYADDADAPGYRKVFVHSLEIYNAERDAWQFAGNLNFGLQARQPITEIEKLSLLDRVEIPVSKNFSVKNNLGDSFGSDWPQRFVVAGSEYRLILDAVTDRVIVELETRGLKVFDVQKFMAFLNHITKDPKSPDQTPLPTAPSPPSPGNYPPGSPSCEPCRVAHRSQ